MFFFLINEPIWSIRKKSKTYANNINLLAVKFQNFYKCLAKVTLWVCNH